MLIMAVIIRRVLLVVVLIFWRSCESRIVIHGLLSLTGSKPNLGTAELLGIQLALNNSKGYLQNRDVVFSYTDTKCSTTVERNAVISILKSSADMVVLIGGNCGSRGERYFTNQGFLPQILFDENILRLPESVFNLYPTKDSKHAALIELMKEFRWNKVVLVSSKKHKNYQVLKNDLENNEIKVALEIMKPDGMNSSKRILKASRLRIIIIYLNNPEARMFICSNDDTDEGRYIWILPKYKNLLQVQRKRPFIWCPQKDYQPKQIRFVTDIFTEESFISTLSKNEVLTGDLIYQAALAHDAVQVIVNSIQAMDSPYSPNFSISTAIGTTELNGVTGFIHFNQHRNRLQNVSLQFAQGKTPVEIGVYYDFLHLFDSKSELNSIGLPESDSVKVELRIDSPGLALFVILTSLATLLIAYSIAILVYIILNKDHKFIKMTSPNLNVIILMGSVFASMYVILRGCQMSSQSPYTSRQLLWAARYFLPMSASMFYGTCLVKVWRVYVIFRNLSRNGKITQDLVLLAVILIFVVLDIILVSIWSFGDTPICQTRNVTWLYESDTATDFIYQHEQCWSNVRSLWVVLFYTYKGAILAGCMYFAWHTRHVTLPSMQDAPYVYIVMYNVVLLGVILVPTMLISSAEETLSYGITGLAVLILTASNTSVLFVPKILHHRKILKGAKNGDERLKFSESLRKTQDAKDKSNSFLKRIFSGGKKETDTWQEALVNEIENLKQTIKQKDATIRELNDRLYVYGADKFQSYIRGDNRRQSGRQTVSGKLQIDPVHAEAEVHHQPHQEQTDGAHPAGDVIETDLTQTDEKNSNGHIPTGVDVDPEHVHAHFMNMHARTNMAYVRSLEDVNLDDSAIDNTLDNSDISDSYRYMQRPGHDDGRYLNVRTGKSTSPQFHSTLSSDDSGIHTVYNGMSSYGLDTSVNTGPPPPPQYKKNDRRPQFTRQKRQHILNYSPAQVENEDDIIV